MAKTILPSPFSLFLLLTLASLAYHEATAIRVDLKHIDSKENYTITELVERAVNRSNRRSLFSSQAPVSWGSQDNEYFVELEIGTPPVQLSLLLDSGSNLIWTKCLPCTNCLPDTAPAFDPSKSTTFVELPCTGIACADLANYATVACSTNQQCVYKYSYLDQSSTIGLLANETFTFGSSSSSVSVPSVTFGCSVTIADSFQNTSGLVGLARGELSLLAYLDVMKFSYCLTPYFEKSTSTLLLGSDAALSSNAGAQTTPFVSNPVNPLNYFISMTGISLGQTLLPISPNAFTINADGSGGIFIDSGTVVSRFLDPAYTTILNSVASLVTLPVISGGVGGLDLCFSSPSGVIPDLPDMIFHFDGADLNLPKELYMFSFPEVNVVCLAILSSPGDSAILGNFQQQNINFLYDLESSTLSFVPAQCNMV